MTRPYNKKASVLSEDNTPNHIAAAPTTIAALTKNNLLGLYYQNQKTISQMENAIDNLKEELSVEKENVINIRNDYSKYSTKVVRVIQEMERNHNQKMQTIFSTVTNLQTLLTPPNYNFQEEEEKNNAV
jgi:hypothetical protein